MSASAPPPFLPVSALSAGVDAFVAVRAASLAGFADARATFELSLAAPSESWGFFVFSGLEALLDALERFRTKPDELAWLESVGAIDGSTRRRLEGARFACDVDAAAEGSVVFPGATVLTVEGPFWQAQLVAALVTSAIAEATLAATKIARCTIAAVDGEVVECGAANAHRLGGAPALARAAFVGGAGATTCAVAGRRYGIPVRAALPSSTLRAAPTPGAAYAAWLTANPTGGIVRVDSRDDIAQAAAAARNVVRDAHWDDARAALEIGAGDRVELAREAARAFRAAGLPSPAVAVSGALDEVAIALLRAEDSPISAFFVSAVVPVDASALARYDLSALEESGQWAARIRLGDSWATTSDPGRKVYARYLDDAGGPLADVMHGTNERLIRAKDGRYVERATGLVARIRSGASSVPLLSNAMRAGKRAVASEPAIAARERARASMAALSGPYKRLVSPARYPVGMTPALAQLKSEMLGRASGT